MRRVLFLLALAPALPALPVAASPTCPQIADATERLACFDAAYPSRPPSRVIAGASSPGDGGTAMADPGADAGTTGWQFDRQTSATTGTQDVFAWVDATEEITCGGQAVRPSLFLRCMDNETAILLVTDCEVTSQGVGGLVSYRVDDGPTRLRTFVERTDRTALGLWDYAAARPFLGDIQGGSSMVLRFSPAGEARQQELTFPLDGADLAVSEVVEACGQ